jgi:hypothetical protein
MSSKELVFDVLLKVGIYWRAPQDKTANTYVIEIMM